jgi:hypothetical protein
VCVAWSSESPPSLQSHACSNWYSRFLSTWFIKWIKQFRTRNREQGGNMLMQRSWRPLCRLQIVLFRLGSTEFWKGIYTWPTIQDEAGCRVLCIFAWQWGDDAQGFFAAVMITLQMQDSCRTIPRIICRTISRKISRTNSMTISRKFFRKIFRTISRIQALFCGKWADSVGSIEFSAACRRTRVLVGEWLVWCTFAQSACSPFCTIFL